MIGEMGSQENRTGEMINHVEEDTLQRVPKANSEQHLVADVKSIAIGVAQRWESLAGCDTLLPFSGRGLRRMTLKPEPVSMTMGIGTCTCARTPIDPETT